MSYTSIYATASDGLAPLQNSLIDLEAAAAIQRAFNPDLVIGLLQTPDYARAILSGCVGLFETPDDTDATVTARLARQRVLDTEGKSFRFLIGEQALLRTVGSAAIMAEQIRALHTTLTARANVEIGIIPVESVYVSPAANFLISDDREVETETVTGFVTASDKRDIDLAARTFDRLSEIALYADDALAVLHRALTSHTDRIGNNG
ncbi:hypothetical protein D7D52_17010 [Nocardia yunnanensis]|uniref:DUF5753 domain-containing protein n=1 Tax=Nocardia yunnanensis TaxID=2382165 RepID=A0A386ZFL6_9NOCA|nr:DUF5753 domain-containing protein [Nocardia yunnanensis]AYF75289.1 hypothetical protein D7D52_17010 [Nocardia yunnanensis]